MEYRSLNKKALGCMYTATFVGVLIFVGLIISVRAILVGEMNSEAINTINLVTVLLLVALVLYLAISPVIRYRRYKYYIDNEKIDTIEGLFFITRTLVPIERIHKIEVKKGPIDSIFKVAKVIVTTAGGDAVIRFLEDEKANEIAEALKAKVNKIVKIQQKEVEV